MSAAWSVRTALVLMMLSSCASPDRPRVIVVDPAGLPAIGVTVTPMAASVSGAPTLTDDAGEAKLETVPGVPIVAVLIEKGGFLTLRVPSPVRWPLHVSLTRVADVQTSP